MHRAPAVSYSVFRSRWHGRLIVLLSLLTAAALGGFAVGQSQFDARFGVMASTFLAVSAIAFHRWQKSPEGRLRWDGQFWFWTGFDALQACRLSLLLDFQRVVLVCVVGDAKAPLWLWLEERRGDPAWKPLRRAMVASQAASRAQSESTEEVLQEDVL